MRMTRLAAVLDACCVLVFVVIGRASHTKGEALAGIASTAWPFLAGLVLGWAAARAWRRPLALAPAGVVSWLATVALGMALRVVSGQGTAVSFIVVALVFLGLFLLGWRVVAALIVRRAANSRPARLQELAGEEPGGERREPGDFPLVENRRKPRPYPSAGLWTWRCPRSANVRRSTSVVSR